MVSQPVQHPGSAEDKAVLQAGGGVLAQYGGGRRRGEVDLRQLGGVLHQCSQRKLRPRQDDAAYKFLLPVDGHQGDGCIGRNDHQRPGTLSQCGHRAAEQFGTQLGGIVQPEADAALESRPDGQDAHRAEHLQSGQHPSRQRRHHTAQNAALNLFRRSAVATALSRFCNGEALFFPSGSWYSASINDALGDDAGWIAFPGGKADSGSAAANAVTAFGIPANAKNKNAAAAFLDFLQSDEARQIAVDNGYPPVGEGETPSTDNQLLGQVLTAYEGLVKTGNTTDYINNATAGMQASAIIPGFQSLIDGTMTPKAFVESIQAQYEKEAK